MPQALTDWAERGARLVYVSSVDVYGRPMEGVLDERTPKRPGRGTYGRVKLACERAVLEQVQRTAIESFRVTECEGMARADCFVVEGERVVVNELNTIPGFTATSVYAKLFEASGIPY